MDDERYLPNPPPENVPRSREKEQEEQDKEAEILSQEEETQVGTVTASPPPQGYDPAKEIADAADKAREFLNTRSRLVCAGIVALVWGALLGESKYPVSLHDSWKKALLAAAALSIVALILDYSQYLFEYLNARFIGNRITKKILGGGGSLMFATKQLATFASAVVLIGTASLILLHAEKTDAQARNVIHIWRGAVWSKANPSQRRPSVLYLSDSNPVTGFTKAQEDGVECKGARTNENLILVCESIGVRFVGVITQGVYEGQWTSTSAQNESGAFKYQYKGDFTSPR